MPAIIRPRNADGSFGQAQKFGQGLTEQEQIEMLGAQLAYEKLSNMQTNSTKDAVIGSLGEQLVQMKIELMTIKGGI